VREIESRGPGIGYLAIIATIQLDSHSGEGSAHSLTVRDLVEVVLVLVQYHVTSSGRCLCLAKMATPHP
jgi:hypothetical protein